MVKIGLLFLLFQVFIGIESISFISSVLELHHCSYVDCRLSSTAVGESCMQSVTCSTLCTQYRLKFRGCIASCQHRHWSSLPNNDGRWSRIHQHLVSHHRHAVQSHTLLLTLRCRVVLLVVTTIVRLHVAVCVCCALLLFVGVSRSLQDEERLLQCDQLTAEHVVANTQLQLALASDTQPDAAQHRDTVSAGEDSVVLAASTECCLCRAG